jgi:hypothetical protein
MGQTPVNTKGYTYVSSTTPIGMSEGDTWLNTVNKLAYIYVTDKSDELHWRLL